MKYQVFLPYGGSSVANYTAWATGIGTALSSVGWTKSSDVGQVNWSNITSTTDIPSNLSPLSFPQFTGAFVPGTAYLATGYGASGTFSLVTYGGITWANYASNNYVLTTAFPNTTNTYSLSSVTGSSSGSTTYTGTGFGGTNNVAGMLFTITGFSNSINNGVFLCLSNTTTTIVLQTVAAVYGGGSNLTTITESAAASASTSSNNTTYYSGSSYTQFTSDALYGLSMTTTGFTNSSNNGTFTVLASGSLAVLSLRATFVVNNASGVTESHAATAIVATVPPSDPLRWTPYNYEIWQANGALGSTSPIYLKIVYTNTSGYAPVLILNIGSAIASTAYIGSNQTGEAYVPSTPNGTVGAYYECDFSGDGDNLAWVLWRNGGSNTPITLFIDRARDQYGNALTTFYSVGWLHYSSSNIRFWTLYKAGVGGTVGSWSTWPALAAAMSQNIATSYNGMTPVYPIFPVPGYIANPCLQAVTMKGADCSDGQLVTAVLYGASHTWMVSKQSGLNTDGPSYANQFPAILWE